MDYPAYVLAHKTDRHLFVELSQTKKGRKQWQHTEDFRKATTFPDHHTAESKQREHRVPPTAAMPREYAVAHSDWLRALEFPPEKIEKQNNLL